MFILEIWGYCILLGNWGLLSGFSVSNHGLRKGLGTVLLEVKQNNRTSQLDTPEATQRRNTGMRKLTSCVFLS